MTESWDNQLEKEFKVKIKSYFKDKIDNLLNDSNYLEVGNNLAELLKSSEEDIVKMITPRAIAKWASPETYPLWQEFMKNDQMILELREIGKSIANTLRPIAGNVFAEWVTKVLNNIFVIENIPLIASTSGDAKKNLNKAFDEYAKSNKSFKPDIDIILINSENSKVLAIISAKTTLAERVMQTISWHNYIQQLPLEFSSIKLFLVTAWETFEGSETNRNRVQQLDGVYVCNNSVKEFGNIKKFSRIIDDIKDLYEKIS